MADELIECKPGIGPFKLNLVALWKWLSHKKKNEPVTIVARRFLQAFQDHGVPVAQIPRLIPQLSLDKLVGPESLLPVLNGEILDTTATLFRIRRAWLEGVGEQIYDTVWCYKAPERFFQELSSIDMQNVNYPIIAFCCGNNLDARSSDEQPIALVLKEKVCDVDDDEVFRYRIFDDGWRWGYCKCRIQLKAMARMVDKAYSQRIPLYRIDRKTLGKIESGCCVPRLSLFRGPLENISLEDFALSPDESRQSKEAEELPAVVEYIEYHKLDDMVRQP
jgi:hypothetical protein